MPIIVGLWMATQKLALLVQYDPLLGVPLQIGGQLYYYPWKYFTWYMNFHSYIPELFKQTYINIYGGFIVGLMLLVVLQQPRRLDSHGSAHWGEYNDILGMDLISASGVVVGLYDNLFTRKFTSFVRAVEKIKQEKVSFAEMDFDKQLEKKRDRVSSQWQDAQNQLEEIPETEMELRQKVEKHLQLLQHRLENSPKYDPKIYDFCTVYPWVWFCKKLLQLYLLCPHFYLRDNSNKHLAVIAPTL